MKRLIIASVAILGLTGIASAEAPQYLSEQAAIASDSSYLVNRDSGPRAAVRDIDRMTTSSVNHTNPLGNYGPTVTIEDLHSGQ